MVTSSVHTTEALLFFTLLQLAVIVLAARAAGALAQRCGQSAVMLVLMALFSTLITSPALRRWVPRLQPHGGAAPAAALGERG